MARYGWVYGVLVLVAMAVSSSRNRWGVILGTATTPAQAGQGMVSSAHPVATQAGLDILKVGGNAFDAAVALAAVLNVVEPMMSGMGGYGTILVYDAEGRRVRFLNSSGRIPAAVDSDVFRAPTPGYEENRSGPKAVSMPGNVHAWEAMSKEYGRLEWSRLFEAALRLSGEGFAISKGLAGAIEHSYANFPEKSKGFYGKNGGPLKAGETLIQKDLARSLRLIAEKGAEAFYRGEIAAAIDREMKATGGFLSKVDLAADQAEWWEPIHVNYRGCEVYAASPPATSFCSLIRLGMMSRFETRTLGHNSAAYLHRFAEVSKHAFWCRLAYAGDPETNAPPLAKLLSEEYWKVETGKIDLKRARPFVPPGSAPDKITHTTHFVVADKWGNLVSATQTLGNLFGSRIMPEGTGIWLNNSLAYCTFEPKGNPMDVHAGHHKLSGDCPTIIFKEGRPWAAIGTPGGHTIGQTVPQMVMNLIDFGMNIQEAIASPLISFYEPDWLLIEKSIPQEVQDELSKMGHKIRAVNGLTNAHGITVDYDAKGRPVRFSGGSDPRGEGQAAGF
ncbi:MAG: gamma-glutamyltransferase [Candidatus Solincola sediminis]|uniref:Glutathione hydrolase proenzyme n=1 Tax=Candidatus Solincola sediminis TaxID=1797199 RepID=A0A1F2WL46_9ACTN|nr:MAG: gamma-glutamyltransferase [Candidatus Solincola sediminis]